MASARRREQVPTPKADEESRDDRKNDQHGDHEQEEDALDEPVDGQLEDVEADVPRVEGVDEPERLAMPPQQEVEPAPAHRSAEEERQEGGPGERHQVQVATRDLLVDLDVRDPPPDRAERTRGETQVDEEEGQHEQAGHGADGEPGHERRPEDLLVAELVEPRAASAVYSAGSTTSVSNVDETMPPMTTVASGRCTSAPMPVLIAIGRKPRLATSAVMITGRSRRMAAVRTASSTGTPSSRSWRMVDTSTMSPRTATPDSATNPTPAEMLNGMSRSQRATIPPVKPSGTPVKTSTEWRMVWKLEYRSTKISPKHAGTTIESRCRAVTRFWYWPPHSSHVPAGSSSALTWACASSAKDPRSRRRTLHWTTTRRFPFSRLT